MSRKCRLLLGVSICLLGSASAFGERHALLIGIEQYEDSDRISTLSAACADARELGKTLVTACGFKEDNVRILTSDGDSKPSRRNLLFELGQLVAKVKDGDTVLFFFSGHGVQLADHAFLVPYDADLRNEVSLRGTTLSAEEVKSALEALPAQALIAMYDMCRNNPKKEGSKEGVQRNNNLASTQAKDLVLRAASQTSQARSAVTIYSCSPGQRSWEWREKRRGFFSYFLEQGLRRDAADSSGTVRVSNLIEYVRKAVIGAVSREEGEEQEPYVEAVGAGVLELPLATGREPGHGGSTAVVKANEESLDSRYEVLFQRACELYTDKKFAAAKPLFEESLALKETGLADRMLGRCLFEAGDLAGAERFTRRALQLTPQDARALNNLATLLQERKEYDEAERLYKRAIEIDPNLPQPLYGMGKLKAFGQAHYEESEGYFRKLVALDPSSTNYSLLATALMFGRKSYDEAEEALKKALASDSSDEYAHACYGKFHFLKKDYPRAEAEYRRSVDLNPQAGVRKADLAMMIYLQGRTEEARTWAIKAKEQGVTSHWVFTQLKIDR